MRHYGICIPNNMASGKAFEDLDLSKEEVKRLGEALKDEKFRKMLAEYAEEISDPENRRKAEEEIAMMENERGMNVQFVHPNPGHVLKTTVDGTTKAFINICQNDKIDKPVAKREKGPTGKTGLMWQIPHSFSPPRDDLDKSKKKCKVFDVVFHPDTYRMATSNERFKKLVEDTALEGIEKQFNVSLDKKNIKRPKCAFKGQPVSTVIRERIPDGEVKPVDPDSVLSKMPYPYDNSTTNEKSKSHAKPELKKTDDKSKEKFGSDSLSSFTEPKYTITHRSDLDMSEYRNAPDAKISTRPKELVVKINLPLLKSSADASLDIFEKKLILKSISPAAYKLDLNLPYPVNEEEGYAKFDKSKKTLTVTLPVIAEKILPIPFTLKEENNSHLDSKEDLQSSELISVISDTLNPDKDESDLGPKIDEFKEHDSAVESRTQMDGQIHLPENVKWLLPEYDTSQDSETISLVLKVQCVEERSIILTYPKQGCAQIKFMSIGAGCFPSYYSLFIEFCEGCHVSSDYSNVDVNADNLVLLLLKDKGCRGLWDFFSIGTDKDNLEIKQFLTESNLKRELSALDEAAQQEESMPIQEQDIPQLTVLDMSAEKLTMEIKPKKKKTGKKSQKHHQADDEEDDEYDEYDPPSSAEIEVIHKQPTPQLHSILKQRTVSESSEDHSLSVEPESPRSGEEEDLSSSCGKRRTVSFNSHVDRASYKSNASVSSMGPALKSKRKKQRRREEKIQRGRRQRNNSGGTSSSEDHLSKESWSDSYSLSEEDGDETEKTKVRMAALLRANSDPGPNQQHEEAEPYERSEKTRGTKDEKIGKEEKEDAFRTSTIPNSSECLDFRTKHHGAEEIQDVSECCENVSETVAREKNSDQQDKNKKMVQEIRGKLEKAKISDGKKVEDEKCDSDDDVVDDDDDGDDRKGHGESSKSEVSIQNGTDECECASGQTQVGENAVSESVTANGGRCMNEHEEEGQGDGQRKDEKDEKKKKKTKSDVETILSWDDQVVNGNEHKTQCAFTFSNNLMFDLDME